MLICFLKIVIPATVTNLIIFGGTILINTMFAARLNDPEKLAAVGLSNVCCNVMVLCLLFGLNSAQETLTSQAYGADDKRLCGLYLNRGRFILLAFFILAVQLFVTLIEFKLTTLAGFVLIPFGLFGKSAFMAERVLGNVISSGIKPQRAVPRRMESMTDSQFGTSQHEMVERSTL